MKKAILSLAATALMLLVGCGNRGAPGTGGAPPPFSITEDRPHVCFVNAGTGIPQDAFDQAVSNACEMPRARWVTVRAETVRLADITIPLSAQYERFSRETALVVYVVSDPLMPRLMSVPGQYALINICSLRNDTPDAKVFAGRLQRILMKALAYAAGVGANQDPICVMYWNSFTVGTIDSTSATYGPYAFFALVDILRAVGTEDIFETPE